MLSKMKMFAAAAVIAMAFVGCAKEETSMSINDLPGRAKVKGTVYYSNAQKYIAETEDADAMLKDLFVPKAEVKVLAKIANAAISGDAKASGYTVFETVTDEQGGYELEIPVPADGIEVELEALPFEGTKSTFDSLYRKQAQFSDKAGVFENAWEEVTLNPNDIKNQDIKYAFSKKADTKLEEDADDNFKKTTLRVNVYEGYYGSYYPSFTTSSSPIEVSISDGNNIDKFLKTENGVAQFEITHTTKGDKEITVRVISNSYNTSLQVPYYEEGEIQGKYQQFYSTDEKWENKAIATVWENGFKEEQTFTVSYNQSSKSVTVYMIFKPDRTNTDFNAAYSDRYYEEWVGAYFRGY